MKRGALLTAAVAGLVLGCRLGTDAQPPAPIALAPRLLVTPDSLVFHGQVGDTVLPDQYVSMGYEANVSGRWRAWEDGSFFFLASMGDTLPFFLPVGPRPAGLAAGTYSAGIWINVGNDTVRIPVTLRLELPPGAPRSGSPTVHRR